MIDKQKIRQILDDNSNDSGDNCREFTRAEIDKTIEDIYNLVSVPAETLVMPMFAEVINNFGEECPYCDNSGQIIHGYSGDSSKDLEMCEFCYTTQNSKFNLYCEIEKVLNASKHSV